MIMMRFFSYFKSRTVVTIIGMVLLNGLPAVLPMVNADLLPYMNLVLGALAIYFRVDQRQDFRDN